METLPTEFRALLNEPEGMNLGFRKARANYTFRELAEHCAALANEGGGKLLLGVAEQHPHTVVGTNAFPSPSKFEAKLDAKLGRHVPVQEYFHRAKRVLILHVPARELCSPWNFEGKFLKLDGNSPVPMTSLDMRDIFIREDPSDFSARPCEAKLSDLSAEAILYFRKRWALQPRKAHVAKLSIKRLLQEAELIVGDEITFAALILFGTSEALGRYLARAETIFEYRSSFRPGPAQDRQDHRSGFFTYFDKLWEKIDQRNDWQHFREKFIKYGIKTFDEASVREAILNAVCHRNYREEGSIFVRLFPRQIEIDSPGGFPMGITSDNLIDKSKPKNQRLADSLAKAGLVKRAGQGVDVMVEASVRQGKTLPDFSRSTEYGVRLTLDGRLENPELILFLKNLELADNPKLFPHDLRTIYAIANQEHLDETMRSRVPDLLDSGIVILRGTRYHLAHEEDGVLVGIPDISRTEYEGTVVRVGSDYCQN